MGKDRVQVVTPKFRASFPSVFQASAFAENQDKKFRLGALFPEGTDLTELKQMAHNAAIVKWGADKIPSNMKSPFRDGAEKPDLEGYEPGVTFINMTSKMRPGVVDQNVQPILEESDFYGGCWAMATVTAYAYDTMGNKGVAFGLQNVQKVADDTPFSGRTSAEDDFQPIEAGAGDSGAAPAPAGPNPFD